MLNLKNTLYGQRFVDTFYLFFRPFHSNSLSIHLDLSSEALTAFTLLEGLSTRFWSWSVGICARRAFARSSINVWLAIGFRRVEVRPLCSPLEFLLTKLVNPGLHEAGFVYRGIGMMNTKGHSPNCCCKLACTIVYVFICCSINSTHLLDTSELNLQKCPYTYAHHIVNFG